MDKSKYYIYIIIVVLVTSCVPTKDLIYLQKKNNSSNEVISSSESKPYRLQKNDLLNITIKAIDPKLVEIFNNSQSSQSTALSEQSIYFNGYTVDDHGNIRMPILGELSVIGLTLDEVRVKVEKELHEQYFKNQAGIYVTVKLSGFRYTINGEVGFTGTKIIYQDKLNIMEAIANSGDITVIGDRKDVKVIRRYSQGNETFSLDLTNANVINSPAYNLQPNDYIYVKPLKQKTWGTGKTGIESLSSIITLISLSTTIFLLLKK